MPMLFAKISPVAQIPQMESPFQYDVQTAEYLTAIAQPYRLGSTEVNFNLIYGNATFGPTGDMLTFSRLLGGNIVLGSPDIQDWGLDDTVILGKICQKLGTSATQFVYGSPDGMMVM